MNMMNEREEKNIYRPDMVHLLMQAKQGKVQLIYSYVNYTIHFMMMREYHIINNSLTF